MREKFLNLEVEPPSSNGSGNLSGAYSSMKKSGGDLSLNLTDRVAVNDDTQMLTVFEVIATNGSMRTSRRSPAPTVE